MVNKFMWQIVFYALISSMPLLPILGEKPTIEQWGGNNPLFFHMLINQMEHVKEMEEIYHYTPFLITENWNTDEEKNFILVLQQLNMTYESAEINSVESCRKMIVDSTSKFLILLNKSPEMQQAFQCWPITSTSLNLRWVFRQKDNPKRFIRDGHIAMATLRDGKITYEVFSEEKGILVLLLEESYEEAYSLHPSFTATLPSP